MTVYLIQIALVFSILYILYKVFLDGLTFHKVNRLVLLLILPVSIIIPFSNHLIPQLSSKSIDVPLLEHINSDAIISQLQVMEQPIIATSFNYATLLVIIYVLVFVIYFIRILSTARQLFLLKNKAEVQQKKGYQLLAANVPEIFSYFKWIFIPQDKFEHCDPQIVEHEKVHIQLKHSWDVVLTEIYIACFWFNPLVYLYRKSLKSVHEFQADAGVLKNGIKTSSYMEVLLQSLEIQKPKHLYNYFNKTILKKRVAMMTKQKSHRLTKLKYILLLPVCVLLVSAFTSPIIEEDTYWNLLEVSEFVNTPPSLFPVENATKDDITSFYGVARKNSKVKKGVPHTGIDIRAKIGTQVFATADGVIAKANLEGDWGNLVVITHADGYETWYAHLKGFNSKEEQVVKKGDVIGYVGNTGLSSGPHLHYEIKLDGKHVDPLNYLE